MGEQRKLFLESALIEIREFNAFVDAEDNVIKNYLFLFYLRTSQKSIDFRAILRYIYRQRSII